MKLRLLAGAIALALFVVPAAAQVNPGTSPLSGAKGGTNNAFMQFTGPGSPIKTYTLPNTSGTIDLLEQAQTFTATKTFAPASGTTTRGIVTSGTFPSSGTSTTSANFNEFNGVNPGYNVTGTTFDAFGGLSSTSTLRANYTASSATSSPINAAVWGASLATANVANLDGVIGSAYTNTTTNALFGSIGFTNIGPTGVANLAIAVDGESVVATGGAVTTRIGVGSASQTSVQGSTLDAAFALGDGGTSGIAPFNTHGPWKNAFVLTSNAYGPTGPPLSSNGTVFYSDAPFTTANFADMGNVTFTGKVFNFQNFVMDGNGYTAIGTTVPPTGDSRVYVTGASRGIVETLVAQNVTTGGDGLQITTSGGLNSLFAGIAEAANTTSRFGVTIGNYGQLITYNANSAGLLIGTLTSKPVILGVNATASMKLETDGGVTVPPTVTGGDKGAGTINATGLYVGGAAVLTANQSISLTGAVTGSGTTSITTSLGSFSSSALATALTDETGTGNAVFNTAPTFSGTVIMPTRVGGSAVGSTAVLNGTSNGSPSSAFVNLQTNGQNVSIGNTSPKTSLDINQNLSTSPALVVATSDLRLQSADNTSGGFEMVTYTSSTATGNIMSGAVATGTAASPGATGTGGITQYMYNMRGYGWNGTSWQSGALLLMSNNGVWSGSNQGTQIDFYTTPLNSTTIAQAGRIQGSGGWSIGASVDPGTNNLGVSAGALLTKAPVTQTAASVTIGASDSSTIFNGTGTQTATLPSASTYPGRWLTVKNIAAQTVNSASSNVVPIASSTAGTALLANTAGKWALLQSDGTNWIVMLAN